MMQWKPDVTSGMVAETAFCRLYVFRTPAPRRRVRDTYTAQIDGAGRQALATMAGFASGEDAQRWAEQAYAELLRTELARLEE